MTVNNDEYSPHAWGWTADENKRKLLPEVFPTRVGMDHRMLINFLGDQRIPHTRGDGPYLRVVPGIVLQYSPHAWGWTEYDEITNVFSGVFPTRVGMDHRSSLA